MVRWTEENKQQLLLAIIEHLNPTSLPWEKLSNAMGPDFSTEAVRYVYYSTPHRRFIQRRPQKRRLSSHPALNSPYILNPLLSSHLPFPHPAQPTPTFHSNPLTPSFPASQSAVQDHQEGLQNNHHRLRPPIGRQIQRLHYRQSQESNRRTYHQRPQAQSRRDLQRRRRGGRIHGARISQDQDRIQRHWFHG